MRFFGRARRGARAIRLTCLALAATISAAVLPLPLPWAGGKDRSRPFPCQDRPCGCRTAEACWRNCCCFTNSQKLAWARANGVAPPEYVVVAARTESDHEPSRGRPVREEQDSGADDRAGKKCCCCCRRGRGAAPSSDCDPERSRSSARSDSSSPSRPKTEARSKVRDFLILVDVLRCRGDWLPLGSLPMAVTPAQLGVVERGAPEPDERVSLFAPTRIENPALPPPAPPPRRSA